MKRFLEETIATIRLLVIVVAVTAVGILTYVEIMERSGAWPVEHKCNCQQVEVRWTYGDSR